MPPKSGKDVRYRIGEGERLLLLGFSAFTELIDVILAFILFILPIPIPFVNTLWTLIAHSTLAIAFLSNGVNPFGERPIPGEQKRKKPKKKRGPLRRKLLRFLNRRGLRFAWSMLAEGAPIPILGPLLSVVPWRTINTYLTIKESREEDEREAAKKADEREADEDERIDTADDRRRRARTEEYLGHIDDFTPEELMQMQELLAQNQSLRENQRAYYEGKGDERGSFANLGQYTSDAVSPFAATKRPSELKRELEPVTDLSDTDKRFVDALNKPDSTVRPSSAGVPPLSRGKTADELEQQAKRVRAMLGETRKSLGSVPLRQAREDALTGKISPDEVRAISEAVNRAGPLVGQSKSFGGLAGAREAFRTRQLSRDDYTRIIEASTRIPPVAKNAFLDDLKNHEWEGMKPLEEYRNIVNQNPAVDTRAKSALFQEMTRAVNAAGLANSYQSKENLRRDIRNAVSQIISRREQGGTQTVPIGVETAADAIFNKIRTEPRNWEPVEDALVDELLDEAVQSLKDRGLGGEVRVTLQSQR